MCAPVHVDVCVNPGQGAVESLALSCCCRDTAVALATAALCKYNYRADTELRDAHCFYDFGMSAFVCISLSPNVTPPCLFNPCAVLKSIEPNLVFQVKNDWAFENVLLISC